MIGSSHEKVGSLTRDRAERYSIRLNYIYNLKLTTTTLLLYLLFELQALLMLKVTSVLITIGLTIK
jgi:hypothetical protein